jgi:hypothetical protein
MMFGGLQWDAEGKNVFAKLINLLDNKALIGVGCPARILNSCVHHAAENLDVDIECIIFKIIYISISTLFEPNNSKSTVILWKLNTKNFFPTVRHNGFHYFQALAELFTCFQF